MKGTNKILHTPTNTQRKGAVALQKTEPNLPASVGGSSVEAWVSRAHHRDGGTGVSGKFPFGVNINMPENLENSAVATRLE